MVVQLIFRMTREKVHIITQVSLVKTILLKFWKKHVQTQISKIKNFKKHLCMRPSKTVSSIHYKSCLRNATLMSTYVTRMVIPYFITQPSVRAMLHSTSNIWLKSTAWVFWSKTKIDSHHVSMLRDQTGLNFIASSKSYVSLKKKKQI